MLYRISYANLIMLGATLPTYDTQRKDDKPPRDVINADDPANAQLITNIINTFD